MSSGTMPGVPSVPFRRERHRRHAWHGFTLIEVLVVLLIIAIVTAVTMMSFGSQFGKSRREKMTIAQFQRTIAVAQQQAILTPEVLGLGFTATGYRYYSYQLPATAGKKGTWTPMVGALSQPNAFQDVFEVSLNSISAFTPANSMPTIVFAPSGYVTPFTITLHGSEQYYTIKVENNGVVHVA